jgi:hypothetical protein
MVPRLSVFVRIRPHHLEEEVMTLAEELRNKYALTSFKGKNSMVLLAINEAIDAAAKIADQEHSPIAAGRIRRLKWTDSTMALNALMELAPLPKNAC